MKSNSPFPPYAATAALASLRGGAASAMTARKRAAAYTRIYRDLRAIGADWRELSRDGAQRAPEAARCDAVNNEKTNKQALTIRLDARVKRRF